MADDDIPITDPNFYSSESLCPDSLIEYIFRPVDQSSETIPLLQQRITIMREVGFVLCNVSFQVCRVPALNNLVFQSFGGSFQGFIDEFHRRYNGEGTALELVQMVTDMFPSFRDEVYYEGQKSAELRIPKSHVADHHGDLFSLSLETCSNISCRNLGSILPGITFLYTPHLPRRVWTSNTQAYHVRRLSRSSDLASSAHPQLSPASGTHASCENILAVRLQGGAESALCEHYCRRETEGRNFEAQD